MAAELTASRLTVAALLILLTSAFLRILYILPINRPRQVRRQPRQTPCHILVVLGSGGHTAEMVSILRKLDTKKYSPRTYVISSGDEFSSDKAVILENSIKSISGPKLLKPESESYSGSGSEVKGELEEKSESEAAGEAGRQTHMETTNTDFEIITVPRARKIHQPLYSTPFSSLRCLIACVLLLIRKGEAAQRSLIETSPELIITNGPATGVIMVLASLFVKFFGLEKGGEMRIIYVESWARVKTLSLSGKILYNFGLTNRFLVQWEGLKGGRREYKGPLVH